MMASGQKLDQANVTFCIRLWLGHWMGMPLKHKLRSGMELWVSCGDAVRLRQA